MKIVFIVKRFHTNLFSAVKALLARGHEVALLCPNEEKAEDHRYLRPTILESSELGLRAALRYMMGTKPDLVIVRHARGKWRYFSYAATLLGIRTIGYDLRPYMLRRNWLDRSRDLLRGRGVYRITPVLGSVEGETPDPKAYYIPFPVESPVEAEQRGYLQDGAVRIICVGKLGQARKQHFLLLEALERLRDRPFTVTFVGAAKLAPPDTTQEYRDRLDAAAETGPLAGRVRILADVPFATMTRLYLEHDVFVLPARREPLGIAPLEAMACGCVPIVSDECGSAGSIPPEHGFVIDATRVDELTSVLKELFDAPESIAHIGRRALAHARTELGPDVFVGRFEEILKG
jgi:glycosyltransferase involved in cell wall biosynthesis